MSRAPEQDKGEAGATRGGKRKIKSEDVTEKRVQQTCSARSGRRGALWGEEEGWWEEGWVGVVVRMKRALAEFWGGRSLW